MVSLHHMLIKFKMKYVHIIIIYQSKVKATLEYLLTYNIRKLCKTV